MKKVCIFLAVAFVATALGFTGCASEDPAKPLEVDWNRTAILKGTILINADISKARADQRLSAPTITKEAFIVSIPYNSLNSGVSSGTYILPKEKIDYRNGEFTITVPVGVSGSTVTVKVDDFTGTLKKTISDGTDKPVDVIWKPSVAVGSGQKTLLPGQTVYFENWILDAYISSSYYTEVKIDNSLIVQ